MPPSEIGRISALSVSSAVIVMSSVVGRLQMDVEEAPHPSPRIALLGRVFGLPMEWRDTAVKRVAAWRAAIHLHIGERRLARTQCVEKRHRLVDIDVLIVVRNVHEQWNLQSIDLKERRAIAIHLRLL